MNERTLIAIGVDRDGTIWDDHFGESPQYDLYDRAGNLVEKRPNPYNAGGGKHKHHGKPGQIVDLLPECGVFIARHMGKPEMVAKLGVQPVITKEKDPQAALAAYLKDASSLQVRIK